MGLVRRATATPPSPSPVLWCLQHSPSTLSACVHGCCLFVEKACLRLGTYAYHWAAVCFTNVAPKLSNQRHESLFGRNRSLTLLLVLFFFLFFQIQDLAVKNPLYVAVSQQKSLCFLILASSHLLHMPHAWFSIQVIFRTASEVSCASSLGSVMLVVGLKGEAVFTSTRTSSIRCWVTASSHLRGSTVWLRGVPSG